MPQRRIVAHLMVHLVPQQLVVVRLMAPPTRQQRVVAHPTVVLHIVVERTAVANINRRWNARTVTFARV